MAFNRYLCWEPQCVHEVIKVDAEALADHVFKAVHTDQPLLLSTTGDTQNLNSATGNDFLEAFVNPAKPDIKGLVLGDAGMGKTHFIHWLRLNLPPDENVRVVNIPKVGTSLRGILRLIIEQLPEDARVQYEQHISGVGGEVLTDEQKHNRLINAIAQAIQARAESKVEKDVGRAETIQFLHLFFYDPYIRNSWLLGDRDDNIIHELAQHVFETKRTYARRVKDRRFKASDFRLPPGAMKKVALDTQEIINIFEWGDHYLKIAADIVNDCLDAAIGDALSFSGDSLIELMAEVREHLQGQGLSLVLFIEDLSRMQGVDKALLQALTTESKQGDKELCSIRWVAAMTTGYMDRLAETLGTRINLLGKVEADTGRWDGNHSEKHLADFMGRYLNAVRLGPDKLAEWGGRGNVASACAECPHEVVCHRAFGKGAGGNGLYPFTAAALLNMAQRTKPDDEHWFKPRRLLKNIVAYVLSEHGEDLRTESFPKSSMVDDLGGKTLMLTANRDLRSKAGQDFERHLTLQELWQPHDELQGFKAELLSAFGLKSLDDVEIPPDQAPIPADPKPSPSQPLDPSPEDDVQKSLRAWGNGKDMDPATTNEMRPLVFSFLRAQADWDLAGISDSKYCGQGKPLRITSIEFKGQINPSNAQIKLQLPLGNDDRDRNEAAVVLEGLYLFKRHGSWDFPNSLEYLPLVQSCLETWAEAMVRAVEDYVPANDRWQAVDGAIELLAVGGALAGTIGSGSLTQDLWDAIWGKGPETASARLLSTEMQDIAVGLHKEWDGLQDLVKAWHSGGKGGRISSQLNPKRPLHILRRLQRNNWSLAMTPSVITNDKTFSAVHKLYSRLAKDLRPALVAEAEAYRQWKKDADSHFGDSKKDEIVTEFEKLLAALNEGAVLPKIYDSLHQLLEAFSACYYRDAHGRAGKVVAEDSAKLPPHLFAKRGVVSAMNMAMNLAEKGSEYLEEVEAHLTTQQDELGRGVAEDLNNSWASIQTHLDDLEKAYATLCTGSSIEGGQS